MDSIPETRDSLLVRLADGDDCEAWQQFAAIYRPLVYRIGRRRGLQDAVCPGSGAAGVAVRVEGDRAVAGRPQAGSVSHVAAHRGEECGDRPVACGKPCGWRGGTTAQLRLQENVDGRPDEAEVELEREYQREVFRWAARGARDEFEEGTWLAFWLSAVEGRPIPEVAEELGKSVGAVYIARSRVIQRLRDKVTEYESEVDSRLRGNDG